MNKTDRVTIFESYAASLTKSNLDRQTVLNEKKEEKKDKKPAFLKKKGKKVSAKNKAILEQVEQLSESVQDLKNLFQSK